jgi:hypothetical protein
LLAEVQTLARAAHYVIVVVAANFELAIETWVTFETSTCGALQATAIFTVFVMRGIIDHLEFLVGSSQDVLDGDKRLVEEWETYVATSSASLTWRSLISQRLKIWKFL